MSSTNNPWFGATLALGGLIAGYVIANGMGASTAVIPSAPSIPTVAGDTNVPVPPPTNDTPATPDDDPVLGEDDAPITMIEFTDYECPFCGRHYEQTYGQIKSEYIDTGKVKLVVRDYPLSFHPKAMKAAMAAECAGDQDMYFDMHSLLFANQATWSGLADAVPTFKQYAGQLGLNQSAFDTCLDSDTHKDEINKDLADGSASGISGTPGFWILGPDGQKQLISGAYPFETFKAAFDGMLQ